MHPTKHYSISITTGAPDSHRPGISCWIGRRKLCAGEVGIKALCNCILIGANGDKCEIVLRSQARQPTARKVEMLERAVRQLFPSVCACEPPAWHSVRPHNPGRVQLMPAIRFLQMALDTLVLGPEDFRMVMYFLGVLLSIEETRSIFSGYDLTCRGKLDFCELRLAYLTAVLRNGRLLMDIGCEEACQLSAAAIHANSSARGRA